MQSTSWEMLGWMKHKLELRFQGKISITSYMQMTPPFSRKRRRAKEPLDEIKEESEKVDSKLNIQKTKIMTSGPIIWWQINGKTGNSGWLYLWGLQNHCRWWLQIWTSKMLAPWKKGYEQPRQHIKKQRITLLTKVCYSKLWFFQ